MEKKLLRNLPSDMKHLKAKELREKMDQLAAYVDDLQNEYEEYERELRRRGLKL